MHLLPVSSSRDRMLPAALCLAALFVVTSPLRAAAAAEPVTSAAPPSLWFAEFSAGLSVIPAGDVTLGGRTYEGDFKDGPFLRGAVGRRFGANWTVAGEWFYRKNELGSLDAGDRRFTRGDVAPNVAVDPTLCLNAAQRLTEPLSRHRVVFIDERGPLPAVWGTDGRLTQVFVNLLTNAIEAMPPQRALALNEVTLSSSADDEAVSISVRDNGVGMTAATLARLGEPFVTQRPSGGGTGLGLAICFDILAEVNGALSFESEVGRGTTATVRLVRAPASARTAEDATPPPKRGARPEPASAGPAPRPRVLLIDDDRDILQVVAPAELGRELFAVHDGHVEVEEHEVDPHRLEDLERLDAVAGLEDAVLADAGELHDLLDRRAEDGRVVDDEHVALELRRIRGVGGVQAAFRVLGRPEEKPLMPAGARAEWTSATSASSSSRVVARRSRAPASNV